MDQTASEKDESRLNHRPNIGWDERDITEPHGLLIYIPEVDESKGAGVGNTGIKRAVDEAQWIANQYTSEKTRPMFGNEDARRLMNDFDHVITVVRNIKEVFEIDNISEPDWLTDYIEREFGGLILPRCGSKKNAISLFLAWATRWAGVRYRYLHSTARNDLATKFMVNSPFMHNVFNEINAIVHQSAIEHDADLCFLNRWYGVGSIEDFHGNTASDPVELYNQLFTKLHRMTVRTVKLLQEFSHTGDSRSLRHLFSWILTYLDVFHDWRRKTLECVRLSRTKEQTEQKNKEKANSWKRQAETEVDLQEQAEGEKAKLAVINNTYKGVVKYISALCSERRKASNAMRVNGATYRRLVRAIKALREAVSTSNMFVEKATPNVLEDRNKSHDNFPLADRLLGGLQEPPVLELDAYIPGTAVENEDKEEGDDEDYDDNDDSDDDDDGGGGGGGGGGGNRGGYSGSGGNRDGGGGWRGDRGGNGRRYDWKGGKRNPTQGGRRGRGTRGRTDGRRGQGGGGGKGIPSGGGQAWGLGDPKTSSAVTPGPELLWRTLREDMPSLRGYEDLVEDIAEKMGIVGFPKAMSPPPSQIPSPEGTPVKKLARTFAQTNLGSSGDNPKPAKLQRFKFQNKIRNFGKSTCTIEKHSQTRKRWEDLKEQLEIWLRTLDGLLAEQTETLSRMETGESSPRKRALPWKGKQPTPER